MISRRLMAAESQSASIYFEKNSKVSQGSILKSMCSACL